MSARKNSSKRVLPSLLAFGNPRLENEVATNLRAVYRGEILAPLPEAEAEVKALKEIWRPAPSKIFVGTEAGKKIFKTEAGKYAVIHLATHGILDDSNPMYSRLVMARAENDPNDDGLLEAREIMQLNLHAGLVVLSACQTARGRVGAGEGMVGMSWSFFVAGVPTMVASQWKVDSASTATLMINFHKRLKNQTSTDGSTKANALRHAALDLMKERHYRHPFFWAGFVMIGNGM
jgi:CHAT domain-containing protein